MLMLLTGSSAAGKTTLVRSLPQIEGLVVHDFDEIGVPADADKVWRHRAMESWFQRALEFEEQGQDLLLACQSPLGEALATPSADLLSGLAVCLIDCSDDDRLTRLGQRDDVHSEELLDAFIGWAEYMRHHHRDPQYRQHVITEGSWSKMRWDRWTSWPTGDPRWSAATINTSDLDLIQSLRTLRSWVDRQRRRAPAAAGG
jgi:hypothetical protein